MLHIGQEKLILRTAESPQSQAIQFQDALEVSKQHLHFLPVLAGLQIGIGSGDGTCHIAGRLKEAAVILRVGVCGQHRAFIGQVA